jgi:hypothetical protein
MLRVLCMVEDAGGGRGSGMYKCIPPSGSSLAALRSLERIVQILFKFVPVALISLSAAATGLQQQGKFETVQPRKRHKPLQNPRHLV